MLESGGAVSRLFTFAQAPCSRHAGISERWQTLVNIKESGGDGVFVHADGTPVAADLWIPGTTLTGASNCASVHKVTGRLRSYLAWQSCERNQ